MQLRNTYTLHQHSNGGLASVPSAETKEVIKNLYLSGIGEEFIALQLDLEIPSVISSLKELGIYRPEQPKLMDAGNASAIYQVKMVG